MRTRFAKPYAKRYATLALVAGTCAITLLGCPSPSPQPSPEQQWRVVERLLTCEECASGELDSVVALGSAARPLLERALAGLPDSIRQNFARSTGDAFARARRAHARLSATDKVLRPLGDSGAFVGAALANFERAYRTRAATAIDRIDPPVARALFQKALRDDSLGVGRPLGTELRLLLDSLYRTPP